eukprot:jgi/Psemu1/11261/gm1.11261_g
MSNRPFNIPIAKRTRSCFSLERISIHKITPFRSLQPDSLARASLFDNHNRMPRQLVDTPMAEGEDDLFPYFDNTMSFVLQDILNIDRETQDMTCEALINERYTNWNEFLKVTHQDIADLTYRDGDTTKSLAKWYQCDLCALISFSVHLEKSGADWRNPLQYTKEAYKAYCAPITLALRDAAPELANQQQGAISHQKSPNQLKFEHWVIFFKAKLETSDIDTNSFLNPAWPQEPLSGFKKQLYAKQCTLFWTLILHVFKSDLASPCVISHTHDHNGRQAYFDVVALHSKSKAKVYDTSSSM